MEYSGIMSRQSPRIQGSVKVGRKTKLLLKTVMPGSIVVIDHDDLDELAAEDLIRADVKAVINAGKTMSGLVMTKGPLLLLEHGTPIMEVNSLWFPFFYDGMNVSIDENGIWAGHVCIPYTLFNRERWAQKYCQADRCFHLQLDQFIENTLHFAREEKGMVLQPLSCPKLQTQMEHRHVLVVTRGNRYREDLASLRSYIRRHHPVLLGVDGGADALLDDGYKPDLIVGDMDSVSDRALLCGAELVVHSYLDGQAPGLERIQRLGLPSVLLSSKGTSEDVALLLAYEKNAELIVTVGTHSHMTDFLEKGRKGMGSTILVRMKVGGRLIDAKGIGTLMKTKAERQRIRWPYEMRMQAPGRRTETVRERLGSFASPVWSELKGWFRQGEGPCE